MDILYYYRTTYHAVDEQKISIFFILFRPHRMQPISTDVERSVVCVCVLGLPVCPAKTNGPIDMPFGSRVVWAQEGCTLASPGAYD